MKYEDLDKVIIGDDPERFFQVRAQLPLQEKEELGLKPEDLMTYSSPLVSFEGKMVVPKGQMWSK